MKRAAFGLVAIATLLGSGVLLPAQDTQDKIERIFDRIEESRGTALWDGIRELDDLGRGALDDIRKGLTRADGHVRIAVAKVLYTSERREEALEALTKVIGGKNAAARKAAADMAAALVGSDKTLGGTEKKRISDHLEKQAKESDDALAQISLWRALWGLTQSVNPARQVRDILSASERKEVKEEAALALAEMDRFIWAKPVLTDLAKEPSEKGRMARSYLKVNELTEYINRNLAKGAAGGKYDFSTLEEAIDTLKAHYYDESKISPEKLIEAATRGACGSLDPYTVYMDEHSLKQLKEEDLGGVYGGIGARVAMRKDKAENEWLTIEEPIFSGPAYKQGLRSDDRIIEVEGKATVNRDLSELVKSLRGKAGTKVTFKVWRRGWSKEREYTIVREAVHLETTMHRMLPGGIGYIRLTGFGEQDIQQVEDAVLDMDKMKALVFDLRRNSGGYLKTAHKIASYFLDKGKLIVSTRGRGEEKDRKVADGNKLTDVPLVMLVDEGSASASEILAGCLQDHKRALIVGERTFGKGSVQDMRYLKSTDEKAAVKITIAKWYLPNGRSVERDRLRRGDEEAEAPPEKEKQNEGGVDPDVKVARPENNPDYYWKIAEFERLRAGDEIGNYIKEHYPANKERFRKIADSDNGDLSLYPRFDPLYESLKTRATKDDVRELVRELIRKRVQDEMGKPLYLDFETDVVLQRGILEACNKASVNAKEIKEYELFAKAPAKSLTGTGDSEVK